MPAPPPEKLRRAFAAYLSGDLDEAERLSRAVASGKPDLFDAWHLLGFVQAAMGRAQRALQSYDRALKIQPDNPEAIVNRGAVLNDMARFDEALAAYDRAIALREAYPPAHVNRGLALHGVKRYGEALLAYDRAIALKFDYADAHANRGAALFELARYEEALASYDRALAINGRHAEAHFNRGNVLRALQRVNEALACYDRALAIKPVHVGARANRGAALHETRRFGEALTCFDQLIALYPNDAEAHYNRGNALHDLGRFGDAVSSFDRALALNPNSVDALYNRANALFEMKRFAEALAGFEQTLAASPDHLHALERAASAVLQLCDWEKRAHYQRALEDDIRAERSTVAPFTLLGYSGDPALQLQCARHYVAATAPQRLPVQRRARRAGKRRIAYFSADLQEHAVAYLFAELFELHDRSRFETIAVSLGRDDGGATRKRIAAAFDWFLDARMMSDDEVVSALHAETIDVAVDLTGHTGELRLSLFARRPAPIQVNYGGFPGTMGAPFIDYILLDRIVAPPEIDVYFTEKIVRLPHCYLPSDTKLKIGERKMSREEAGLPRAGFVFACFNSAWKITPDTFDIWMRLLIKVESSVLWLLPSNPAAEIHLRSEAEKRSVAPNRLIFAPRMTPADHLARHQLADLFLDTLPYNAHSTARDALWTGLPLITLPGQAFASRVAASMLHAVGLPELIARNADEYEALAVRLSTDPALLAAFRQRLAANRLTAPLFDSRSHARAVEAAFDLMVERHDRGEAPASFDVEGDNSSG